MIVIFSRGDDFSTRDVKNKLISMGQDVVVIEPMAAMEKFSEIIFLMQQLVGGEEQV